VYCGTCGLPLAPATIALERQIEQAVVKEVERVLENQVKDRKVLEIETAEAITTRVWGWGKMFGAAVAVPLLILGGVLALIGYKSFADISKAGDDAKAAIQKQTDQLREVQTQAQRIVQGYKQYDEALKQVGEQLPSMQKKMTEIGETLESAQTKLAQIPAIQEQLRHIESLVGPGVTLNNEFISRYGNRTTIDTKLTIDMVGKVLPTSQSGGIHVAAREPSLGFVVVANIMNAKDEDAAIDALRRAGGANTPIAVSGVWRLWFVHSSDVQIQGGQQPPAASSNPDHVLEVHPVTQVDKLTTARSFHPIEGYKPKDAVAAFSRFESLPAKIVRGPRQTTITSASAGYNYVEFLLEVAEEPQQLEDGWVVLGRALDLQGNKLTEKRRMLFVKGTPPADKLKGLRVGTRIRVIGMPRIDLAAVSADSSRPRAEADAPDTKLPYEIVIVGAF
jgi:hypothetical protein